MMIYIILALFLLLFVFAGYLFFKIIKLQDIKQSLELCTDKINDSLDKKSKIIEDILANINNKRLNSDFKYDSTLNLYEKEKTLFDMSFSINKYLKEHKKNNFDSKIQELNLLEENLDGLKDFYNAHVLNYNEIFLKKYLNKIYRIFKFEDYKSFKIRKLEEYEIFKI